MNGSRKRRLGNERAPCDVTGVKRNKLRQALLADGRTQSIRSDQEFALQVPAIAEMHNDLVGLLFKAANARPR